MFLRPEDVVVEEAVAVICRLLCNFGSTDAAVPYERGNTVERRAEVPRPVHMFFAPELMQQSIVLDSKIYALANIFAEPGSCEAVVSIRPSKMGL